MRTSNKTVETQSDMGFEFHDPIQKKEPATRHTVRLYFKRVSVSQWNHLESFRRTQTPTYLGLELAGWAGISKLRGRGIRKVKVRSLKLRLWYVTY